MRMTIRSTLAVAAVSGAALLGGCAVAPYDNGYGYNQGYGYNGYGNGYGNGYNGYGYAPGYYDPGYVAPSVEFGVQYSDRGDRRQWRDRDRWHDDRDNDRRREWHGDRDGRHD